MKKVILLGLMAFGAANAHAQNWLLLGNSGTNPAIHAIGTTDNKDVVFKRWNSRAGLLNSLNTSFGLDALNIASTGTQNTAIGQLALYFNTTGSDNTAVGVRSLYSNTSGTGNVAHGYFALNNNTTGNNNAAVGNYALYANNVGNNNVANGNGALLLNTSGTENVAVGYSALRSNVIHSNNTAVGSYALYNSIGDGNTASGSLSLYTNTSGYSNTATGYAALYSNTGGYLNTATGLQALYANTTGTVNTATGIGALGSNTTGSANTADGTSALVGNTTGQYNTATGHSALFYINSGSYNTAIGTSAGPAFAGSALNYTTAVGAYATPTASNQVWLGGSTVNSVRAGGAYTIISDGRFKNNIKENVPGLEFINQLKPVTYNYKIHELNDFVGVNKNGDDQKNAADNSLDAAATAKEKIVYTGFVAQEVEKAAEKVGYNFSGVYKPQNDKDPYGLSYSDFVVPLVKAVQELSAKNEEKQTEINQLNAKLKVIEEKLNKLINNQSGNNNIELDNKTIVLDQNVPNPFSESTVINYSIEKDFSNALISITDNSGVVIKTHAIVAKGKAQLTVYGNNLSSGVYHYSLIVDGKVIETKSIVKN